MFGVQRLTTNLELRTSNNEHRMLNIYLFQGGKIMVMIHTFEEIEAWQKARQLSKMVYEYTKYHCCPVNPFSSYRKPSSGYPVSSK